MTTSGPVTAEARRYGAREWLRRAGFTPEEIAAVAVETFREETLLTFAPGRTLAVPHRPFAQRSIYQSPNVARVEGAIPLDEPLAIPTWSPAISSGPLFAAREGGVLQTREDLISAILFLLGRWEELEVRERDRHQRFTAASSWQKQMGLLHRPLVDEYGLALSGALTGWLAGWKQPPRNLRVFLSHDIDDTGYPRSIRRAAGHLLKRKNPAAFLRDMASWVGLGLPAELASVRTIASRVERSGLRSAFFWKGSGPTPFDTGYNPAQTPIREVVRELASNGFELGVHPGYFTFGDRTALLEEIQLLRNSIGGELAGGRQHFLRWSPSTWLDWEACGMTYDSSLGFADEAGFRGGTSWPYFPWSFIENRPVRLLEIPLIVMDRTLLDYMRFKDSGALELAGQMMARCAKVGGVFSLLWHNTTILEPGYSRVWDSLLDHCAGKSVYNWRSDAALWQSLFGA